jgi:hypothetical protein
MEWQIGRLSEQVLNNAKSDYLTAKRLYETEIRRNDVPQDLKRLYLQEHPSPPKLAQHLKAFGIDFEGQKAEILARTKNEPEGRIIQLILADLSKLMPKHLSPQKELCATNLLGSIVTLHGEGVRQGRIADRAYLNKSYPKKMKEIDEREIDKATRWIFSVKNQQADQLKGWLEERQKPLIRTRNGNLLLRENTALSKKQSKSFQSMIRHTHTISWKEAFRQACEENGVNFTIKAWNRHRKRGKATPRP